ncbi:protein kinase family protein [Wenzhouxiangella sp. AB-CW3]|uniref:protein kinase family protein n=1 Tax=Wenzhouxiangella sp. AB-CW3 TaxID=2771012 RepID=UPI00168B15CE|nr:protein kinase family protein [Wenzhouxiangella sp. AB-CW3]QOC23065.1 protein kinase family protein [Wenzhouxiangella sp. AB-CW3]
MSAATPQPDELEALFADFEPDRYRVIARSTQGIIVQVDTPDRALVVKAPVGHGPRRWLSLAGLRREHRAYQRLSGIGGFARCFGLYHGHYLVLERLQAEPLKQATLSDPAEFFRQLLDLIRQMHSRGVAHGDLKSRQNVMVDAQGQPFIVDLGTAVIQREGWHPISQRLFQYMRRIDYNSWIKLKYGGYEAIDPADRHLLDRSLIERINSRIRRG